MGFLLIRKIQLCMVKFGAGNCPADGSECCIGMTWWYVIPYLTLLIWEDITLFIFWLMLIIDYLCMLTVYCIYCKKWENGTFHMVPYLLDARHWPACGCDNNNSGHRQCYPFPSISSLFIHFHPHLYGQDGRGADCCDNNNSGRLHSWQGPPLTFGWYLISYLFDMGYITLMNGMIYYYIWFDIVPYYVLDRACPSYQDNWYAFISHQHDTRSVRTFHDKVQNPYESEVLI